ncbi:MAG: hypothetical protein ACREMP_05520 [Candidatus Tyrphobacter sp.]
MKRRLFPAILATAALATAVAPAATGRDATDIGYVDQSAIAALPAFVKISRQMAAYRSQLDGQYNAALRTAGSAAGRQRVAAEFNARLGTEQRQLAAPAYMRVQLAIASVASRAGLSVVVDKRIIIYGGVDITQQVVRLLGSTQTILPLGTAPPPSDVGFVDQTALENSAQVQAASKEMQTFAQREQHVFGLQLQRARSDQQRQQQIAAAYNAAMNAEQNRILTPVVQHEQQVTAQIAQRRGLLLVIDHTDVLYGGTDITTDVQNALNK